jgi:hypothetical protein
LIYEKKERRISVANCNAVKIRPRKNPPPTPANLAHNSAMKKANYWLNDGAEIIQSKAYTDYRKLNEDFKNWEKEAEQRYSKNESKKRKLRTDAVKIEEGMLIVGTDVEISNEDIVNIINDFVSKFEKENNTKIRHWAYHNHEGHIDEDSNEKINRHIHFLFDNIDQDGEMVRKNWKKTYFSQLQDDIWDISKKYVPDIERGKKSSYHTVKIGDREVKINSKKGVHHRVYRKQKEQENQTQYAKQKDLQDEIKKLRAELQLNKAIREDYARVEAVNKDLKNQIRNEKLESSKMLEVLKDLRKEVLTQKDVNSKLEHDLKEQQESKEMYQDVIFNIDSKMKEIEKIFEDPELIKALEDLSAQESNNLQIEEDELLMIIRKNSYEKKTLLGKKQEINSNAFINDFKSLYKKKSNKNEQSIKRLLKALKSIGDFYSKQFTTLTQEKKINSTYEQNKKPFTDWRDIEIVPVYDEKNNFQKR